MPRIIKIPTPSDNIDVLKIVAPTEAATTDFTFKLIDNDTSSPLQAKDLGGLTVGEAERWTFFMLRKRRLMRR